MLLVVGVRGGLGGQFCVEGGVGVCWVCVCVCLGWVFIWVLVCGGGGAAGLGSCLGLVWFGLIGVWLVRGFV